MENKDTRKEEARTERDLERQEAAEIKANGKQRRREHTRKVNKLWIWLGVIILIFILVWWLWTFGIAEDVSGVTNG